MNVRPFEAKDAPVVAALHRLALPRGFLSTLGDGFLGRLYELLAAASGSCVWVAADDHDRCVGFVAGSLDIRRSYRQVLRRGAIPLAAAAAPNAVRPATMLRIMQTLAYPLRRGNDDASTGVDPADIRAELLSIAVSDTARGHGLGRRLVVALEERFRDWGHHGLYRVVTDASDPRSNAFYVALGFTLVGQFNHHEHLMSLYTRTLPEAADAPGEGRS